MHPARMSNYFLKEIPNEAWPWAYANIIKSIMALNIVPRMQLGIEMIQINVWSNEVKNVAVPFYIFLFCIILGTKLIKINNILRYPCYMYIASI